MKFILVWFILTGTGPATGSAEFNTKWDCESARSVLLDKTSVSSSICLAKGSE